MGANMKKAMLCALLAALLLTPVGLGEALCYRQITQEEAAQIMDGAEEYILLDVRTEGEYDEGHIPGAINLPNEDNATEAPEWLSDKDRMILVYCRSGRRSKQAAEKLAALGYARVLEFGGIMTWPGEIVSTEEEALAADDLGDDDPFEARAYADPEEFYEDYMDDFDGYDEAEEYYSEHGGW